MLISKDPPVISVFECLQCHKWISIDSQPFLQNASQSRGSAEVQCHRCRCIMTVRPNSSDLPDQFGRTVLAKAQISIINKNNNNNNSQNTLNNNMKDGQKTKSYYFYEVLQLDRQAPADQIKKAYYKLAMKHHPDKYQGPDPAGNEEHFKLISRAYQVLSEPSLRDRYDRYGQLDDSGSQMDAAVVDPETLFQQLFGGDRFVDYIGELALSRDLGDIMHNQQQQQQESDGNASASQSSLTAEQRAQKLQERVLKLAKNLTFKLDQFVRGDLSAEALQRFENSIRQEADDLQRASYGVDLLHAIGFIYLNKARQWLGREDTVFGLGSVFHSLRDKGQVVSETFGVIRSAVELQSTLKKLQVDDESAAVDGPANQPSSASSSRTMSKAELEQKAAEKGLDTLWKGSKLEIQSVLREVCDLVLSGVDLDTNKPIIDKNIIRCRAVALKSIGKIFEDAKPDPTSDDASK